MNIDLPEGVGRGLFAHWAAMVVSGQMPTGRTHWTGAGRPFSRELYDRFLVALETAGIIHDYGDGKGRVLTTGGKHSLKRFLRSADTLSPTV
jgi:ribosomal protein S19E (S16A)